MIVSCNWMNQSQTSMIEQYPVIFFVQFIACLLKVSHKEADSALLIPFTQQTAISVTL